MVTTNEILEICRTRDRREPWEVVICSNAETLCSSAEVENIGWDKAEIADEMFGAGAEALEGRGADYRGEVRVKHDSIFQNWNGGRHCQAVVRKYYPAYGFRWVVCYEKHLPMWLKKRILEASDAMAEALGFIEAESTPLDLDDA